MCEGSGHLLHALQAWWHAARCFVTLAVTAEVQVSAYPLV
jgi:hypothetical protein